MVKVVLPLPEEAAPMINCGFIVVSVRYKKSGNEEGKIPLYLHYKPH
jgi:hypothetical protein